MQKFIVKKQILNMFTSILCILVSGCATDYPCGDPSVGRCSSVSENYQRSFGDYTNADDVAKGSNKSIDSSKPLKMFNFSKYKQIPSDGAPLISQPTMIRVWLTQYTDNDNVYHEQGYEYMLTDKGHWLYGNNSRKINNGVKNISLIQGSNNTANNPDGSFGLPIMPTASTAKTTPNSVLNDYPAFNALQNQSINKTITPSANGTTTIYAH